jgi:hypothetical protein
MDNYAASHFRIDDSTYTGLPSLDNRRIYWDWSYLKKAEGYTSTIWVSQIQLRIHSAMLEVAVAGKGSLTVAADHGFYREFPTPVYRKEFGDLTSESLQRAFDAGELFQMAEPLSQIAWSIFNTARGFDFYGLHIDTFGLPDSPAWGQ